MRIFSLHPILSHQIDPSAAAIPSPTSTSTYTAGQSYGLAQTSYSYSYTYTTATTFWTAPTFATPRPLPPCTDAICPAYGGATCVDAEGILYGIICNTRLGGIIIVDSGKLKEREAEPQPEGALQERSYTGTFEGCTGFCDTYNKTYCVGVSYEKGVCLALDQVNGNFPAPGFAAVRLS